jgi:hypothetical protein
MKVTEKFTRQGNEMKYEVTIEDPEVTRLFHYSNTQSQRDTEIFSVPLYPARSDLKPR